MVIMMMIEMIYLTVNHELLKCHNIIRLYNNKIQQHSVLCGQIHIIITINIEDMEGIKRIHIFDHFEYLLKNQHE